MNLTYGTMEEFGLNFKRSHVHRSKNAALLEEFVESGKEVAEVQYDQKTAKSAYCALSHTIQRYKERYANLIEITRRGERVFLIRKKL